MKEINTNPENDDRQYLYWPPGVLPKRSKLIALGHPASERIRGVYNEFSLRRLRQLEDEGLLPVVFVDGPSGEAKEVQKEGDRKPLTEWEKDLFKRTLKDAVASINHIEDGKPPDQRKPISWADVEKELDQGKFGPNARAACNRASEFLRLGMEDSLIALVSTKTDIPPNCPVVLPLDKSGRRIRDGYAKALILNREIDCSIRKGEPAGNDWPSAEDIVRARLALDWISNAMSYMESMAIRQKAIDIERAITKFEQRGEHWTKWHPPKELIERDFTKETDEQRRAKDKALKEWLCARSELVTTMELVQAYAKTVGFINYISQRKDKNGMERLLSNLPTVKKGLENLNGVHQEDKVYSDKPLRSNIFSSVDRGDDGRTYVHFKPPPDPRDKEACRQYLAQMQAWLHTTGPDVDQIHDELSVVLLGGKDFLITAGEDRFPEKIKKYPPGSFKKRADGQMEDISGQDIPRFNFSKSGVDINVKPDGTFEFMPFRQYYWSPDYSYRNYSFLGVEPVGEKIYFGQKPIEAKPHQHVACMDSGRLIILRADKVKPWAEAQEKGDDIDRWIDTGADLAMLITGLYELRAATLIYRAGGVGAERAALVTAGRAAKHLGIAGTGFGEQFIINHLDANFREIEYGKEENGKKQKMTPGEIFSRVRGLVMLADMTAQTLGSKAWKERVDRRLFGKEGFGRYKEFQELNTYANASFYGKFLKAMDEVALKGEKTRGQGLFALMDYYLIFDTAKILQRWVDLARGRDDPLMAGDIQRWREGSTKRGDELYRPLADYDRPSPFPFTLTPDEMRLQAKKVFDEYSLLLSSDASKLLLRGTSDVLFLPNNDSPEGKKRKETVSQTATTFRQSADPEVKQAAAIFLLSSRQTLSPSELLGGDVRTEEALKFLKEQLKDSSPPKLRLLAADFLLRSSIAADQGLAHQKTQLEQEEAKYKQTPTGQLKESVERNRLLVQDATALAQMTRFDYLTMASICAEIIADTKASKDARETALRLLFTRVPDVLFPSEDDSPEGKNRKATFAQLDFVFRSSTDREVKTAAAIALLSNRKTLSPNEKLGGSVTASSAIEFLREQLNVPDSPPGLKLLAADGLLRLSHGVEDGVSQLRKRVAEEEAKLKNSPKDDKQKKFVEEWRALERDASALAIMTRFDYSDIARVCMSILADPKAPKEVRANALVGQTGPRLDFILQYLKYYAEPLADAKPRTPEEEEQKVRLLASLHSFNSKDLETLLTKFSNDPSQDKDLRILALQVLSAEQANRLTVNGMPISFGSQLDIGTGETAYVRITQPQAGVAGQPAVVEPNGIHRRHATIVVDTFGERFIRACDDQAEVWVRRIEGNKVTLFKVGKNSYTMTEEALAAAAGRTVTAPGAPSVPFSDKAYGQGFFLLKNTDEVILGDKNKGVPLQFGQEPQSLLVQTRNEWRTFSRTPDAYSTNLITKLKADLTRPIDEISKVPETAGQSELLVNKFRAAVALERLGPLADLGDERQRRAKLNEALLECFSVGPAELKTQVIEYLTPERIAQLTDKDREMLRTVFEPVFRSYSQALSESLPDDALGRSFADFCVSCCEKLPHLYRDASPEQRARIVGYLDDLLNKEKTNRRLQYPANFPQVRIAAVDTISQLNPALARATLESVVRNDVIPAVRLRALDKLFEIGSSNLRQLCIDLLAKEEDLVMVQRLYTTEYFERRPDRASPEFQRAFDKACETLRESCANDLSGSAQYLRSPERVKEAAGAHQVYNDRYVKGSVYEILTNGQSKGTGALSARKDAVRHAAEELRNICASLPAEEAKKMRWALVSCLLHQNSMDPSVRLDILEGLNHLYQKKAISKEDYLVALNAALQNEMQRTPKAATDIRGATADTLQKRIIELMQTCQPTRLSPVVEAIADLKEYPLSGAFDAAKKFVSSVGESTEIMRSTVKAAENTSPADLATILQRALREPELDAESLCLAMCSSLNGRPITGPDDPRRNLLLAASKDSSPRVQLLAGIFLFQSKVTADREEGAQIIASYLFRPNRTESNGIPDGYKSDAWSLVTDIEKNAQRYNADHKKILDEAIKHAKVFHDKEAARMAFLGWLGIPTPALESTKPRKSMERSLDYQWAYSRTLTALKMRWAADIQASLSNLKPFPDQKYDLVGSFSNGGDTALGLKLGQHKRDYPAVETLDFGIFKFKYPSDKQRDAIEATRKEMWQQYKSLIDEAVKNPTGPEAKFLRAIILTQGSPFMRDDQAKALVLAADGVHRICSENKADPVGFDGLIASVLIESPLLPFDVREPVLETFQERLDDEEAALNPKSGKQRITRDMRLRLIDAYLLLINDPKNGHFGQIRPEDAAVTLAAILQSEYRFMPKAGEPGYEQSKVRQLKLLKELDQINGGDRSASAVLEAIVKDHPMPEVKEEGARILRRFAQKDVSDFLEGNDRFSAMKILPDDLRLPIMIEMCKYNIGTPEERLKLVELLLSNGTDDVKKTYQPVMLHCLSTLLWNGKEATAFDSASLILSLTDDKRYRDYAIVALTRLALRSTDKSLVENASVIINNLNAEEKKPAINEMHEIIRNKETPFAVKTKATDYLSYLMDDPTSAPVREDLVIALFKLAVTGGNDAAHKDVLGQLGRLSPAEKRFAAGYALTWCQKNKNADKELFSKALSLAMNLYNAKDSLGYSLAEKLESPRPLFKLCQTSMKLLGPDHPTTVAWLDRISPEKPECLIRPLKNPGVGDLHALDNMAATDNNDRFRLAAAYALAQPKNTGAGRGDLCTGTQVLADLALHAENTGIRDLARAKLIECTSKENVIFASPVIRNEIDKLRGDEQNHRVQLIALYGLLKEIYEKAGVIADPFYSQACSESLRIQKNLPPPEVVRQKSFEAAVKNKDWGAPLPFTPFSEIEDKRDLAARMHGKDSLEVARLNLQIVKCWLHQGLHPHDEMYKKSSLNAAQNLCEVSLSALEKKLGADSPEVADAIYRLASVKLAKDKPAEAVADLKKSLAIYEKSSDQTFVGDRAWVLSALSFASAKCGDSKAAKEFQEKLIELSKGNHSPEALAEIKKAMLRLADCYRDDILLGLPNRQSPEALVKESLRLEERLSGAKSPAYADVLQRFATIKSGQGNYAEAVAAWQRCLQIYEAQNEDALARKRGNTMALLIRASSLGGDDKTAQQACTDLIKLAELKHNKDDLTELRSTLCDLAEFYLNRRGQKPKDAATAELLLKAALKVEEKLVGKDSPAAASILQNLAYAEYRQNEFKDAADHLKIALQIYGKTSDKSFAGSKAITLARLSMASRKAGDEQGAKLACDDLLQLAGRDHLPNQQLAVEQSLKLLGKFYAGTVDTGVRDYEAAERLFTEVLRLEDKLNAGRGDGLIYHDTLIALAKVLESRIASDPNGKDANEARAKTALLLLDRALKVYERPGRNPDPSDRDALIDIWQRTGNVYKLIGKNDEAQKAYDKVQSLKSRTP